MTAFKILSVAAACSFAVGAASVASSPASESAAGQLRLSSTQIAEILNKQSGDVPPNCQVYEFEGQCFGVVCWEDDPVTPFYDPVQVLYDCSDFGL